MDHLPNTMNLSVIGLEMNTDYYISHAPVMTTVTSVLINVSHATGHFSYCVLWHELAHSLVALPKGTERVSIELAVQDVAFTVPIEYDPDKVSSLKRGEMIVSYRKIADVANCFFVCKRDPDCIASRPGVQGCYLLYPPLNDFRHITDQYDVALPRKINQCLSLHKGVGLKVLANRHVHGQFCMVPEMPESDEECTTMTSVASGHLVAHNVTTYWKGQLSESTLLAGVDRGTMHRDEMLLHMHRGTPRVSAAVAHAPGAKADVSFPKGRKNTVLIALRYNGSTTSRLGSGLGFLKGITRQRANRRSSNKLLLHVALIVPDPNLFRVIWKDSSQPNSTFHAVEAVSDIPAFEDCRTRPDLARFSVCGGPQQVKVMKFELDVVHPKLTMGFYVVPKRKMLNVLGFRGTPSDLEMAFPSVSMTLRVTGW
jgi:hypothetical protein